MTMDPSDIEPIVVEAPTLEGLVAEIAALRLRVARVEGAVGMASNDTMLDLPEQEAVAMLGGNTYRLEEMRADAKKQRALNK